ncbi:hypothetical protein [Cohnella luojiensis]|uniref:YtkA-like domain-containing protein n=1 Tax=Cohnella luojiensis TaxID=652876 RepID=A0A4Y8LNX7_9BACL|nr:hypothetical protein [Cohnella luojiensis]TFE19297.1 hypothetical protein E2980_23585 [Cohnella luojiensis]
MKRLSLLLLIVVFVFLTACTKQNGNNQMDHGSNGMDHGSHAEKDPTSAAQSTSAVWKLSTEKPKPNTDTAITIQIQDNEGKPIDKFDINHEKKMHLIVVSKDLSFFDHIHPEYKGDGKFVVTTQFPNSGDYKLIADYVPTGSSATSQSEWISIEGSAPEPVEIIAETNLAKTINNIDVKLSFDHLMANKDLNLTFNMVDAKTKKPVTDLQPYLGAVGHVVIISADAEQYLHVHPIDEKAKGPDAQFMTKFPKSGVYKVWGQFQRNGETFIVPFVVDVP